MLLDLEAGRPCELEPIIGSILERARAKGVATPRLDLAYSVIKIQQDINVRAYSQSPSYQSHIHNWLSKPPSVGGLGAGGRAAWERALEKSKLPEFEQAAVGIASGRDKVRSSSSLYSRLSLCSDQGASADPGKACSHEREREPCIEVRFSPFRLPASVADASLAAQSVGRKNHRNSVVNPTSLSFLRFLSRQSPHSTPGPSESKSQATIGLSRLLPGGVRERTAFFSPLLVRLTSFLLLPSRGRHSFRKTPNDVRSQPCWLVSVSNPLPLPPPPSSPSFNMLLILQRVPASKKKRPHHPAHEASTTSSSPTPPILPSVRRESLPLSQLLLVNGRDWPTRSSSLVAVPPLPELSSPPSYPPIGVGVDLASLFAPNNGGRSEEPELKRFASLKRAVTRKKDRRTKVRIEGYPGELSFADEDEVRRVILLPRFPSHKY